MGNVDDCNPVILGESGERSQCLPDVGVFVGIGPDEKLGNRVDKPDSDVWAVSQKLVDVREVGIKPNPPLPDLAILGLDLLSVDDKGFGRIGPVCVESRADRVGFAILSGQKQDFSGGWTSRAVRPFSSGRDRRCE